MILKLKIKKNFLFFNNKFYLNSFYLINGDWGLGIGKNKNFLI